MTVERTRVVVADDHPIFRGGVTALLRSTADIEVVGEAASGTDALRLVMDRTPSVAVLDIGMPGLDGIAVIRKAVALGCPTRFAVLSVYEDRAYVRQALDAGARAYLVKRSARDNLVDAVRALASDGFYLDATMSERARVPQSGGAACSGASDVVLDLTAREGDVLRLIALGFTAKEVATRIGASVKSVESHKARGVEKLGLTSRAKLVRFAMLQGWFDPERE